MRLSLRHSECCVDSSCSPLTTNLRTRAVSAREDILGSKSCLPASALPLNKQDFGTPRWQLCDEAYITFASRGTGPWQVLADATVEDLLQLLTTACGRFCCRNRRS